MRAVFADPVPQSSSAWSRVFGGGIVDVAAGRRRSVSDSSEVAIDRGGEIIPVDTLLRMGTHTLAMSKNIAISDDVYWELKREKGDRSFSEVIRDRLEEGRRISDVTGVGVLDPEIQEHVKDDIEQMSGGTLSRFDDESV